MDVDDTLKQAMAYQKTGQFREAERLYRQISIVDANNAALLHGWASVLFKLNEFNKAIEVLQRAAEIEPGNARIHIDLALALLANKRSEEARAAFEHAARACAGDTEAANALGTLLVNLKRYRLAIPVYQSIVQHMETSPGAWINLGNVHYLANQFNKAADAFRHATHLRPNDSYAQKFLGFCLLKSGRLDECIAQLSTISNESADTLSALASAYERKGDTDRAVVLYKQSLEIQQSASAYIQLGNLYQRLEQLGMAEEAFRNAINIETINPDAYSRLAFILERTGQLAAATEITNQGLQINPDDPYLLLANATIKRRQGKYQSAIEDLTRALKLDRSVDRVRIALEPEAANRHQFLEGNYIAPTIFYELGTCYDGLDETSNAFYAFSRANSLMQMTARARQYDKEEFIAEIRSLMSITPAVRSSAGNCDSHHKPNTDADPLSLVGFPRSGTTLTGNILDSHPSIQVLDEAPLLDPVQKLLAEFPGGYPLALKSLSTGQLNSLRNAYYTAVDHRVRRQPGTILIDKLPLNLVKVVILWRLFPEARFVLVLRHPCDVCLSCFMQNFSPNHAMNHFYTLEDAARLYDQTMRSWLFYNDELPINTHHIRYEDLLENFDDEVGRMLEFIGVPWDDSVRSFDTRARRQESIATPSYHQVIQPIYKHARFRWVRYRNYFTGALPQLEPYIEMFGYR